MTVAALPNHVDVRALKASVSLLDLLPVDSNPKRVGRDQYKALCAFHAEKTPSMSVRLVDGEWTFYCFGCQAKGDLLTFVMRLHRMRFPEALRFLGGERFNAPVAPPMRRRLSDLVMACETPGCGRSTPVERSDIPYVGKSTAKTWVVLPGGRTYCPVCSARLQPVGSPPRTLADMPAAWVRDEFERAQGPMTPIVESLDRQADALAAELREVRAKLVECETRLKEGTDGR